MQLDFAILADSAQISEGKMFIHGGGLNIIRRHAPLPVPLGIVLAFQLSFDPDEADQHYDVQVWLDDQPIIRGDVFTGELPAQAPKGLPLVAPNVVPLGMLQLERDGIHRVSLHVDGEELKAFPFSLVPFEE